MNVKTRIPSIPRLVKRMHDAERLHPDLHELHGDIRTALYELNSHLAHAKAVLDDMRFD